MCNSTFEQLIFYMKNNFHGDFDKLDWNSISSFRFLSEEFIEAFHENVNWSIICTFQRLSEDFIRKFSDKVDYKVLGNTHSDFTLDFIFENKSKLNMKTIKQKKIIKNCIISYLYKQVDSGNNSGDSCSSDDDKALKIKNYIKKSLQNNNKKYTQDAEFYYPIYVN